MLTFHSHHVKLLSSVMRQFKFVNLVCEPTRFTMCSSSQIDVLMTTDVQCFESTKVFPFSGSNHHLIVSHFYSKGVCVYPPPHRFVVVRNFQKLDITTLDEILACDDIWDSVLSTFDDISECLEFFNLIMNGLLDLLLPLKKLGVHLWECPWLSNGSFVKAHRLRDVAHHGTLKSGSASDWSSYRIFHNKVNSMLWSAKSEYFGGLAASFRSTSSKFWRHFQCLSKQTKSVCDVQFSATADAFNDYFLSVPLKTVANVASAVSPSEYMAGICDGVIPTLEFVPVDVEAVSSFISALHI